MNPGATPNGSAQARAGHAATAPGAERRSHPAGLVAGLLGFSVVLLGWQVALTAALLDGLVGLGAYAGIHFGGCILLAAWLVWRRNAARVPDPYLTALQILAWSAAAGPFGAFVAVSLAFGPGPIGAGVMTDVVDLWRRRLQRRSQKAGFAWDWMTNRVAEWLPAPHILHDVENRPDDPSAIDRVESIHLAMRDRRIRVEGAHHIRPLMDVIAEGSQSEKLEALGVVYRKYDAGLGVVLKRALQDPDTPIRVLAATVTAKLNATFSRKIGDCQAATVAMPDLAQSWQNLAAARLAYAESGLLEASRARVEIAAATEDLARAAAIDPLERHSGSRLDSARRQLATWRAS
jgi:hypothetical protein